MPKSVFAVCIVFLNWAQAARGGVAQGNPLAPSFVNMRFDYQILSQSDLATSIEGSAALVRIDVVQTYRSIGYFMVGPSLGQIQSPKTMCAAQAIKGTKVSLFWVGQDCTHSYFKQKFQELKKSIGRLGLK